MRLPFRGSTLCLGMTISLLLAGSATVVGAPTPAGTLRCDGKVYVGNDRINSTAAVYAGDRLRTEEGQATVSFSHGDFMVLRNQTGAAIQSASDGLVIGLTRGELVLSSSSTQGPRVDVGGLLLTSEGKAPGLAQVAMKSDGTIAILVHRGVFSVAHLRPGPVVVSADQMLTVQPRVEQKEGPVTTGTGAHGNPTLGESLRTFRIDGLSHNASMAILVGSIGGAAAAAIIVPNVITESTISPSRPF